MLGILQAREERSRSSTVNLMYTEFLTPICPSDHQFRKESGHVSWLRFHHGRFWKMRVCQLEILDTLKLLHPL